MRDKFALLHAVGCRAVLEEAQDSSRSCRNRMYSGTLLGRAAKQGESPVHDIQPAAWVRNLSTAGHEESCWNLGGPPSKAKHTIATDSE